MKKKRLFIGLGTLSTIGALYFGAIVYWFWKWETPNLPLPPHHLSFQDSTNLEGSNQQWGTSAQQKLVDLAKKLQSVSISGAMTVDGELVWAGSVGLARITPEPRPATVKTQYRVGSVSKPITVVALMRMVEKGMIDIDAPIQKYLPNYPRYEVDMTARQLASHMGGVRHYAFNLTKFPPTDSLSNNHFSDVQAALSQFKDDNLLFSPGQGFSYSTHGYTLLSAVMQAAGGKRFEDLVAELVTEPIGMRQTKAEHRLENKSELAGFYTSADGLYGITPPQNLSNKVAGGGFVSTPTDLARLGAALINGTILDPSSFDEMVEVQPMFDGSDHPQYYALGWRHYETSHIIDENHKIDVIHHGGVAKGADAFLLLVPDHGISVAILTNGQGEYSRGEIQMLAYGLARMVIKENAQSNTQAKNGS